MDLSQSTRSDPTGVGAGVNGDRMLAALERLDRGMSEIGGTAVSEDGLVEVTVGPHGRLVDLVIDPRVFRQTDSHALADAILEAARAASEDASGQLAELNRGVFSEELSEIGRQVARDAVDRARRTTLL